MFSNTNFPESNSKANPIQSLDEPLDMTMSSRKRPHTAEPTTLKSKRPLVTSSSPSPSAISKPKDLTYESSVIPLPNKVITKKIKNSLLLNELTKERNNLVVAGVPWPETGGRLLINSDVDGGLENHFRRSLCKEFYNDVDIEGVDRHFSRSLGPATWKEIQRLSTAKGNLDEKAEASATSAAPTSYIKVEPE